MGPNCGKIVSWDNELLERYFFNLAKMSRSRVSLEYSRRCSKRVRELGSPGQFGRAPPTLDSLKGKRIRLVIFYLPRCGERNLGICHYKTWVSLKCHVFLLNTTCVLERLLRLFLWHLNIFFTNKDLNFHFCHWSSLSYSYPHLFLTVSW